MAQDNEIDIRAEVVKLLLDIVAEDRFPSSTMLRMIEQLANQEERALYARVLMDNIKSSQRPSIPMMRRLVALT